MMLEDDDAGRPTVVFLEPRIPGSLTLRSRGRADETVKNVAFA
jgi:hypothetical protein